MSELPENMLFLLQSCLLFTLFFNNLLFTLFNDLICLTQTKRIKTVVCLICLQTMKLSTLWQSATKLGLCCDPTLQQ